MAKDRSSAREGLLKRMKKGLGKGGGGDFENTSIFKSGQDLTFWAPEVGKEHWFDIVPYKAGAHDPDVEQGEETYCFQPYMHYKIGPMEKDVICLAKTYGKPCAICDYVKKMISEGKDEEDINALKVQRNPRAIYNVYVQDTKEERKKGIQILHASHFTIEGPLLELASRPTRPGSDEIDPFVYFASPDKEGKTISFKRKSKFEFIAHQFVDRDYEIPSKLLKEAHTLDELVVVPTYKEQEKWLFGDEDDDEDEEKEEKKEKKERKSSRKPEPEPDEEEDDDDVEPEEEEEEDDDLRDTLENMSRDELKKFIKKGKLDIRVKLKMTEKEIVELILEQMEGSSGKKADDDNECPSGYVFGKDNDEKKECEECPDDVWKACAARCEELDG